MLTTVQNCDAGMTFTLRVDQFFGSGSLFPYFSFRRAAARFADHTGKEMSLIA